MTVLWKKVSEGRASPTTMARMERWHRNMDYLRQRWPELLEQYSEEWVAIAEGRFVAHNPDRARLREELAALGIPRDDTVVRFLSRTPMMLNAHLD